MKSDRDDDTTEFGMRTRTRFSKLPGPSNSFRNPSFKVNQLDTYKEITGLNWAKCHIKAATFEHTDSWSLVSRFVPDMSICSVCSKSCVESVWEVNKCQILRLEAKVTENHLKVKNLVGVRHSPKDQLEARLSIFSNDVCSLFWYGI
jgi:hypothetical protein